VLYENRHLLSPAIRFADALVLPAAAYAMWGVDLPRGGWVEFGPKALSLYAGSLFLGFLLFSRPLQVYQGIRTRRLGSELASLALCGLLALGLGSLTIGLHPTGLGGPQTHLVVGCVGIAGLLGFRFLGIGVLRRLRRRGRNVRTWLLVGDNDRAGEVLRTLDRNPHYGIQVAGIVDARSPTNGKNGSNGNGHSRKRRSCNGSAPRLGDLDRLPTVLSRQVIDEVILTLPLRSHYDQAGWVVRTCAEAGVPVRIPSPFFEGVPTKMKLVEAGDLSMMTYYNGPSTGYALAVKRIVDLLGSSVGLLLLSPVLAGIAAAIWITSGRPILFRQRRVGVNGRQFWLNKFRTMVPDAEARKASLNGKNEAKGPVFKIKEDPRKTPIGRFLRKYHLDEFPQLWNVFRGDMSLVGPRPPVPSEVEKYEWWQRRRLSFPPGLTGLWQVRGTHDLPFARWVELDLEYIDRWSLSLDFRLIAGTLPKVFRGTGC